jgi:hypothetical protein
MRHIRIVGLSLVAVFAMTAVTAASASAAAPEFTVASKFESKGGAGTLETSKSKEKVKCTAEKDSGENAVGKTVSKVTVTFTGCESSGFKCSTSGQSSGEIKTNPLKGELVFLAEGGKVTTKVGLALEPETGTEFVEFNCAGGIVKVKVKGSVLGEIKPIKEKVGPKAKTTHYTLTYTQSAGTQHFTEAEFKNNGKLVKDTLETSKNGGAFEGSAEETSSEVFPEKEGEIT